MPDITVNLTEPLDAALRRAAMNELDGGADDLLVQVHREALDADSVDEARRRIKHAGLVLDELGYLAGHPRERLTVAPAALHEVAERALDNLQAEIREPGCVGHEHSPSGLRASAELWDQLEDLLAKAERESSVAS